MRPDGTSHEQKNIATEAEFAWNRVPPFFLSSSARTRDSDVSLRATGLENARIFVKSQNRLGAALGHADKFTLAHGAKVHKGTGVLCLS